MALTTVRSTGISSLPAISGANLTTLNASNISSGTLNSARFSGGKILQIKHASTSTAASTTANSWSDSNLSCSITPISASNTLLVEITQNGCAVSGSNFASLKLRLLRDSTTLVDPFSGDVGYRYDSSAQNRVGSSGFVYKDTSHNTTSAITYKTQILVSTSDSGGYAQAGHGDSEEHIILMEIGG